MDDLRYSIFGLLEPQRGQVASASILLMLVRELRCVHEQSKKEGKDQESIQSSITPDTGYQWECNKLAISHHKQGPRSQRFPSR